MYAARSQNRAVSVAFARGELVAGEVSIIETYVKLTNISNQQVEGLFFASIENAGNTTIVRNRHIDLGAKDSVFIPIKIALPPKAKAGKSCRVHAVFTPAKGMGPPTRASAPVIVKNKKNVRAIVRDEVVFYENAGDSITVNIQLFNDGNANQQISVACSHPDHLPLTGKSINVISVRAFSDTILSLKIKIMKAMIKLDNFDMGITFFYQDGTLISKGIVKACAIKNKRRYREADITDNALAGQQNQISASTQYGNAAVSHYLHLNAQGRFGGALVQANTDLTLWQNPQQLLFQNTWIGYKNSRYGATMGSLSKFSEISLMGRGAQVYYKPDDRNFIEAGVLDKSYSLTDGLDSSLGRSLWLSFAHNGGWLKKQGIDAIAIYDYDNYSGTRNYITSGYLSLVDKERTVIRAGTALSAMSLTPETTERLGGAAELQLTRKMDNFFLTSNNYFSSPYFSGMRKGVLNLNQRLNLTKGRFNFWYSFSYLDAEPKLYNGQPSPASFLTIRHDAGFSKHMGKISLVFSPYLYKERRIGQVNGFFANTYSLSATRLNFQLTYQSTPTRQNLRVSAEVGNYRYSVNGEKFHLKCSSIYRWKMLNLSMLYQYNNFYLGEAIYNLQSQDNNLYSAFTFSPSYLQKFFRDRLLVNLGMTYMEIAGTSRTTLASARADYSASDDFSLFASGQYSSFGTNSQVLASVQLGLVKRFNTVVVRNSNNLIVRVKFDSTNYGYELNSAAGVLVMIGDKVFKTDQNGVIIYKAVPTGYYNIQVMAENGWYAPQTRVLINSDQEVFINLTRMSTIRGKVSYKTNERSYQILPKKNGLKVNVYDVQGNFYRTKTGEDGNFRLFVPSGEYSVSLDTSELSDYIEFDDDIIEVCLNDAEIKEVNIGLSVREREIETKRFFSGGFPKLINSGSNKNEIKEQK